ncbi:MAG: methylmalonyl-CoA mutase, partial [Elusimicrobia bacterium]
IEERAWKTLERVRAMGGMIPAISKGVVQAEIQESAYLYQKDIETKRRKIVGINCYEESASDRKKSGPATLKVSPQLEEEQKKRLAAFKSSRDGAAAAKAVLALTKAAASKENLFPIVSEAVKRGATVGEICNGLRTAFGEYNGA